jgi:hypothetical protein
MGIVKNDTIGSFNKFLKDQQEVPGQATMSIVLFDTKYDFYAKDTLIQTIKPFDSESYAPSGNTALYDAVGRAIDETGKKLADMKEEDRPGKVIFVILTDGEENSSKEYTQKQVFDKIAVQRDIYKWEFVFLAAGQEAFEEGQKMGMSLAKMAMFTNDAAGTTAAYDSSSSYIRSLRRSGSTNEYESLKASNNMQEIVNAALKEEEDKKKKAKPRANLTK